MWSVPFGFYATAACGYMLVIGLLGGHYGIARTLLSAVGCLIVAAVSILPTIMTLHDFGCHLWKMTPFMALFAVPTAVFQVFALPDRGTSRLLQVVAHISVAGASFMVAAYAVGSPCGVIGLRQPHVFSAWPALFALLPFVALAVRVAKPQAAWRLGLALVLAVLPVYAAKTRIDARLEDTQQAVRWPMRVYSDFMSTADHYALWRRVSTIRPGVPVRIGEHWYRFERIGFQNPISTPPMRRPDRILTLQLDVPADDLDLREVVILAGRVQLNICATTSTRCAPFMTEPSPKTVIARDRDLSISVVVPLGEINRDAVRDKIRRFIQKARVEQPTQ